MTQFHVKNRCFTKAVCFPWKKLKALPFYLTVFVSAYEHLCTHQHVHTCLCACLVLYSTPSVAGNRFGFLSCLFQVSLNMQLWLNVYVCVYKGVFTNVWICVCVCLASQFFSWYNRNVQTLKPPGCELTHSQSCDLGGWHTHMHTRLYFCLCEDTHWHNALPSPTPNYLLYNLNTINCFRFRVFMLGFSSKTLKCRNVVSIFPNTT